MINKNNLKSTFLTMLDKSSGEIISAEMQLKLLLFEWVNEVHSLDLKIVILKYYHHTNQNILHLEVHFKDEFRDNELHPNVAFEKLITDFNNSLLHCPEIEEKAWFCIWMRKVIDFKIKSYEKLSFYAETVIMPEKAELFSKLKQREERSLLFLTSLTSLD
jgi:hypothetical protein